MRRKPERAAAMKVAGYPGRSQAHTVSAWCHRPNGGPKWITPACQGAFFCGGFWVGGGRSIVAGAVPAARLSAIAPQLSLGSGTQLQRGNQRGPVQ